MTSTDKLIVIDNNCTTTEASADSISRCVLSDTHRQWDVSYTSIVLRVETIRRPTPRAE